MTTSIGYASLQVIPSLKGMEGSINRQLAGIMPAAGRKAGEQMGTGVSEGFGSRIGGVSKYAKAAALGVGVALGAGALGIGKWGMSLASANEQAQISFETMLGSAQKAGTFLNDLRDFAATTPFEFPELQTAASSLISAGIAADKVIPIMTSLGDVTSGMGTGSEGIKRATVALQQMNAAGRITGEDLNQLRDAGIPVYDLLAASTGKAKEEVAALAQEGKLGRKELDQLMAGLESGKGLERFSGLMEKQSKSLSGLVSTLKDNLGQGLATAMEPAVGELKNMLPAVTDLANKALPVLSAGMVGAIQAAKDFAAWITPIGRDVGEHLMPVLEDLADIAGNALPAAVAVAGGAIKGAAASVGYLADQLQPLTGFLADHNEVLVVAGAAYVGYSIATGIAAGTTLGFVAAESSSTIAILASKAARLGAMALSAANTVAVQIETIAVTGLTSSFVALMGAEMGAAAIGAGAFAGIAVGATLAVQSLQRSAEHGKAAAEKMMKAWNIDGGSTASMTLGLVAINDQVEKLSKEANRSSWSQFKQRINPFDKNTIDESEAAVGSLADQAAEYGRVLSHLYGAGKILGATTKDVDAWVKNLDLDSATLGPKRLAKAIRDEVTPQAKLLGLSIDDAITIDPEILKANEQRVKDSMSAVASSFSAFSDVLQVTDNPVDPKAVAAARDTVTDAIKAVSDARQEAANLAADADSSQRDAAATRIEDAQSSLDKARTDLAELLATDSPLNREKIANFYQDVLTDTQTFSANIQEALQMGYDPGFVSRLLQAGPEQAGPILEQLVGDASQSFVDMVNFAEQALSDLNTQATEMARLTQIAVSDSSENGQQMVKDLDTAIAISLAMMTKKGTLSLETIATAAGTTVAEVQRVAGEFNLALADVDGRQIRVSLKVFGLEELVALAGTLGVLDANGNPVHPGAINAERLNRWGGMYEFASGGITPAHVGSGTLYKWAEPETGGEAFIPRLGDRGRSEALMASISQRWFGGQYVTRKELSKIPQGSMSQSSHSRGRAGGRGAVTVVAQGATARDVSDELMWSTR